MKTITVFLLFAFLLSGCINPTKTPTPTATATQTATATIIPFTVTPTTPAHHPTSTPPIIVITPATPYPAPETPTPYNPYPAAEQVRSKTTSFWCVFPPDCK